MKVEAGNIMGCSKGSKGSRGRRNFMIGFIRKYSSFFSFLLDPSCSF